MFTQLTHSSQVILTGERDCLDPTTWLHTGIVRGQLHGAIPCTDGHVSVFSAVVTNEQPALRALLPNFTGVRALVVFLVQNCVERRTRVTGELSTPEHCTSHYTAVIGCPLVLLKEGSYHVFKTEQIWGTNKTCIVSRCQEVCMKPCLTRLETTQTCATTRRGTRSSILNLGITCRWTDTFTLCRFCPVTFG